MSLVEKALEKAKEDRAIEAAHRGEDPNDPQRQAALRTWPTFTQQPVLGADDPAPTLVARMNRDTMFTNGLVPAESDRVASAEQYRVIKHDLVRYSETKVQGGSAPQQFVLVTSAQPGDGKSFTSVNLALSLTSERDHDVLLIDGDVAKRHITRSLGLADKPGLLDALRDPKRRFSSVMYTTDVPRLQLLPVGEWSEDATELLSSERMRQFLGELNTRYPKRMVVIDSSPALLLPDARALAGMVGQIVLVVKAGVTLRHDVTEAVAQVAGPRRRVVTVLNQMESNALLDAIVGHRYGYGYGYGYGGSSHRSAQKHEAGSAETSPR